MGQKLSHSKHADSQSALDSQNNFGKFSNDSSKVPLSKPAQQMPFASDSAIIHNANILEVRNLYLSVSENFALQNISFSVKKNSLLAIVG